MGFTLALGIAWVALGVGCAPELPPTPPMPPQHVDQTSNQIQLTNQLEQLTRSSYKLGTGDVIRIRVDGQPDLSKDVPIGTDGTIAFESMKSMKVTGLTVHQLESQLRETLAKKFANTPSVRADVVHYRTQHIYVLGAVQSPGVHPLQTDASLLDMLSQAGGPTSEASWVLLLLPGPAHELPPEPQEVGRPRAMRFDLEKLLIGMTAPKVNLMSGDVLFVPERGHYFIMGGVERPGQYRIERDMTVIRAISRAGGYAQFAAKKYATVWRYHVHDEKCMGDLCLRGYARRDIDEPPRQYRVNLHEVLQPGDVLVVPQSLF